MTRKPSLPIRNTRSIPNVASFQSPLQAYPGWRARREGRVLIAISDLFQTEDELNDKNRHYEEVILELGKGNVELTEKVEVIRETLKAQNVELKEKVNITRETSRTLKRDNLSLTTPTRFIMMGNPKDEPPRGRQ